jgi:hypothetical protein
MAAKGEAKELVIKASDNDDAFKAVDEALS